MLTVDQPLRLFIAVELPEGVRTALNEAVGAMRARLARAHAGLRWAGPEGMHLTLKFLGNVATGTVPALEEALRAATRGMRPFSLTLQGTGAFPDEHAPRTLWAGLAGDLPGLHALREAIETATAAIGYAREPRAFRPHVALARLPDHVGPRHQAAVMEALRALRVPVTPPLNVREVSLMQSTLLPTGAVYRRLAAVPLASG